MLFPLFTFDYAFECCGVAIKISNLQCKVQMLGQVGGVSFSTKICVQCAKDNNGSEISHMNFFTSVSRLNHLRPLLLP